MTEILLLAATEDLRAHVVAKDFRGAGFLVKDERDMEIALKSLRLRCKEGNPFAGLVIVGTSIFGDCNDRDLLLDVMQLINVAEDNEIGRIAFISQILHGSKDLIDVPVFGDRNGTADVVRYFQTLGI